MPYTVNTSEFIRPFFYPHFAFAVTGSPLAVAANVVYWWHVGLVVRPFKPFGLRVYCSANGTGTQGATLAFATTPDPPGAAQTLTVLQSRSCTTMASASTFGESTAFTEIPAGVQLWGGMMFNFATSQPTIGVGQTCFGLGEYMTSSGTLNPGDTHTGTVSPINSTNRCIGTLFIA